MSVQACAPTSATQASCSQSDPASPAKAAGLEDGDRITEVGTTPVSTYGELVNAVRATPPGKAVPVTYVRDGKTITTEITFVAAMRAPIDNPSGTPVPTSAFGVSNGIPAGTTARRDVRPDRGDPAGGRALRLDVRRDRHGAEGTSRTRSPA